MKVIAREPTMITFQCEHAWDYQKMITNVSVTYLMSISKTSLEHYLRNLKKGIFTTTTKIAEDKNWFKDPDVEDDGYNFGNREMLDMSRLELIVKDGKNDKRMERI